MKSNHRITILALAVVVLGSFIGFRSGIYRDQTSAATYRRTWLILPFDISISVTPLSSRTTSPFNNFTYADVTYSLYGLRSTQRGPFGNGID